MSKKNQIANTIDEKHTEMLNYFYTLSHETIPQFQREMVSMQTKLVQTNNIEEQMELSDKIQCQKENINKLKRKRKNYLLDNSKYIFNYFEKKKDISEGGGNKNVKKLNSFFKIKGTTQDTEIMHQRYNQAKNIYHHYWRNVNYGVLNMQDYVVPSDVCECCHKGELIPQDEEGILICNNSNCGTFITYIVDSSKPNNKEPPNEVSYTAYIRLNHFKEILSQFQAKETTQIPEEVIDAIRARIKKERITDLSHLNYDKMREILRKLGLNKYFEHIQYINSIFGIKPPIMSEELHETLCVLFIEIQKPWALHCPANRTNFFNYTYTLYQLCVLLDQTQYLPYIMLMKDVEKQREQDQIWKKVCEELQWEFQPSV